MWSKYLCALFLVKYIAMRKLFNFFRKNYLSLFAFFFLWIVFSLTAASFLDPDFGWHLRTGEWILKNRAIPTTDPFSYTMPSYHWINAAWLADLGVYKVFNFFGHGGSAIFFGVLAAAAFLVNMLPVAIGSLLLIFLAGLVGMGGVAVRPQVISYLLAAVWYLLLRKSFKRPRVLLALPFIAFLWANLHGGFLLGLVLLTITGFAEFLRWIKSRDRMAERHIRFLVISGLLCLLTTLINPFGWRIFQLTDEFTNWRMHFKVMEWLPYADGDFGLIFYGGWLLGLAWTFRRRLTVFEKIVLLVFGLGFLAIRRLTPYFLIFSLPITGKLTKEFFVFASPEKNFKKLIVFRRWGAIIFSLFVLISVIGRLHRTNQLSEQNYYPGEAVNFLRLNPEKGEIFSNYNWGGYLLQRLPDKKTFIDGRMPRWRENDFSSFDLYNRIISGKEDFRPIFDRYGINRVVWPAQGKEWLLFGQKLSEAGWRKIYQDKVAEVWEK